MTIADAMLRCGYRAASSAALLAALPFRAAPGVLAVNYGGARSGDLGGPLVKVRHLNSKFPEHHLRISLLYVLSNAIYLYPAIFDVLRARGIPSVLNQNGVFYPGWYPDEWERENARMAKVHAKADHVLYQSDFCRRCAERFLGARRGGAEVLFNGVDTNYFSPRAERPLGGPFKFLITGKFGASTAYRLASSIEGLAYARKNGSEVVLEIAGYVDPQVLEAAKCQSDKLHLTDVINFYGPYTGKDAPEIYRNADAYLITKYNDPCPNVVLEALASGLPILYSDSGGVPELVGAHAGVALPLPETFERDLTPSAEALAKGMDAIIRNRDAMGTAARRRAVARFDLRAWLMRHEELFAQMVR